MPNQLLKSIALLATVAGQGALAQNSDLGLLLGLSFSESEVTRARIRSSVGVSVQINYAYQVFGSAAGDLYLEFPVVLSGGSSAEVSSAAVVASNGATVLFTPGVRFKLPVNTRLALYGALGAGIGAFDGNQVIVSSSGTRFGGRNVSPALGFGGGIDVRLTRLLSLRGEVRDIISLSGLGGTTSNHHVFGQFGIGFHF